MRRICALLLAVLLLTVPAFAASNPMLHAANGQVVDAHGAPVLLRCVNLSPWLDPEPYLIGKTFKALLTSPSEVKQKLADLAGASAGEAFWEEWGNTFVTEADFRHLAEEGFNCVRLPVNSRYVSTVQNNLLVLNAINIAPVDRAVEWGGKYGIYVIIDLHALPGGQNSAATVADVPSDNKKAQLWEGPSATENQHIAIALWQALATHYAKYPAVGGYDLMNEPVLPSDTPKGTLPQFYSQVIGAIRKVDPNHMVILEGDKYAHDFTELSPPPDANVMYEFHEYSMFNSDWKHPNQDALKAFLDLRASSHMPLWLGEFGEDSLEWQTQMVQLMQKNQIGWAIWPWKRIDLDNGHPAIETIGEPESWHKVFRYITGAWFSGKPSPEETQQGMKAMLDAIRTENCKEDQNLEKVLSGR